jgi:hypothetical protein
VKPTKTPAQGRYGLIGIWVGVAVMSVGAIALFRLGGDFPRSIVGIALAVCLGMVIVMLLIDRRAERETTRLTERR